MDDENEPEGVTVVVTDPPDKVSVTAIERVSVSGRDAVTVVEVDWETDTEEAIELVGVPPEIVVDSEDDIVVL